MSKDELEARALELPHNERAELARQLIASLDEDDDVLQSWIEAARVRDAELLTSTATAVPASRVFAEARSESGWEE